MPGNRYFSLVDDFSGHEIALDADRLADLAGVSRKTACRWIGGTQKPHPHTLELLKIKAFGVLPDPAFKGFRFSDGVIYTPSGQVIGPRDLNAFAWLRGIYYLDFKAKQRKLEPNLCGADVSISP